MRVRGVRLAVGAVLILLVIAVGWTVWQTWHVQRDLRTAQTAAEHLRTALEMGDTQGRDSALAQLSQAASAAKDRTDGPLWSTLTYVPWVGDDATGVRAVSRSLDTLSADAAPALIEAVDSLDGITAKGSLDLDVVNRLDAPVAQADAALAQANGDVADLDVSGYAGALQAQVRKYQDLVGETARALDSADRAVQVLPGLAGADGPRDYLLVLQNNAEIRATGGMPGAWAVVHADQGKLSMTQQGTATQFGERDTPILPLSRAEVAVYDRQFGTYFQDANFTPDFPRAAELWAARWQERFPGTKLDGVLSLDPVAMSYLLRGTGAIRVDNRTLTSENVVEQLLSRPYLSLAPEQQDRLFGDAARALFDAATSRLASPLRFVTGFDRAAREGRFLVAPFDQDVLKALSGTRILGAISGDDGSTPHVDIAVNDATGSKMSYYLRFWSSATSTGCTGGVQSLTGSVTLNQQISQHEAAALPRSVTGAGRYGTERGSQLLLLRLYGPYAGSIDHIRVDGRSLDHELQVVDLNGRPAVVVSVLLTSRKDVVVNWSMSTAPDQADDAEIGLTPSVEPGKGGITVASAC